MSVSSATPTGADAVPPDRDPRGYRRRVWPIVRRASFGTLALVTAVALALNRPLARSALLIGLLTVSFAYVVAPIAGRVRLPGRRERRPLPIPCALALTYIVVLAAAAGTWLMVADQFREQLTGLKSDMPMYAERAKGRLELVEMLADRFPAPVPVLAQIRALTRSASRAIRKQAATVFQEIRDSRPILPWLWLVPLIALLLVSGISAFRRTAVSRLPEGHLRWRGDEFFSQLNSVLAGYVRAQLLSCLAMGFVSTAGFWLIGVPYALLLGTIAGVLEFFPVVGPLCAAIGACTLVSGERLLILIAFLVAVRLLQDYVVYPKLAGRGMHLHPAAVIIAIFAGAELGGMIGVLAAIPAVGIASVTLRHVREYWEIENLLRDHRRETLASDREK